MSLSVRIAVGADEERSAAADEARFDPDETRLLVAVARRRVEIRAQANCCFRFALAIQRLIKRAREFGAVGDMDAR